MTRDESGAVEMLSRAGEANAPPEHGPHVLGLERRLARRMLRFLHSPPIRLVLWNGESIAPPENPQFPVARVFIRDRAAFYRLLTDPDREFGRLFSDGRITVEGDLVAFLEAVYQSMSAGGSYRDHLPGRLRRAGANNLSRARANIHTHYDIGNDFYRLWLDEAMVYTCAYFAQPEMTLEAAQQAKMEHVCRKLRLRPGQRVVEAGCGWGALAIYMAQHHGVSVRAFNISHEQVAFARERAKALGLEGRVEFVEDDYRNIAGKFDSFVSVGMLEHVGPADFETLGKVIDGCLSETGLALIHSIGRHRPMRMNPWIAECIFPGGYTPALSEMMCIFEPNGFAVLDVENLRLHYARTLRGWLDRYEAAAGQVEAMFDVRFVRMWRLYLAGSLVAFTTGWMELFQVVFTRATNNQIPMTRADLYR